MSTTPLRMLYITSCTDAMMWYSDRVGQFVPLVRRLPEGGWLSQEPGGLSNIVHKLDAEEVTVYARAEKLGKWPHIQPTHKFVHIVSKDVLQRAQAWPVPPEPQYPPGGERLKWPPGTGPQAKCRDACMLGSCKGLGDCQERQAKPPAPPPTTGQSRRSSAIEAATNIVVGFAVSLVITALLMPAFGHHVTLGQNVAMTSVFTVASFVRAYGLRRVFNLFESRA